MFWIGGDGAQGFTGGAEQNAIDHLLVLISRGRERLRHGKNHVEIFDREQFSTALFEPLRARERLITALAHPHDVDLRVNPTPNACMWGRRTAP